MSAAALGLTSVLGPLGKVLASTEGPPIIWLKGSGCTGCTVSLANLISGSAPVDLGDLLINTIDLVYHPTLMGAAGDLATQTLNTASAGAFVLVVEGAIPTMFNGRTCSIYTQNGLPVTALSAVQTLAPMAAKVLAVGTCASYGGITGAMPDPTGAKGVSEVAGVSPINIPGCPPHPDWIVWTIANLLAGSTIYLDSDRRPTYLYGATVHSKCSRKATSDHTERPEKWATSLNDTGLCMNALGCKGRLTYADCPIRQWNNGVNWCVGADSPCQGCTQPGFPDFFAPLFSTMGSARNHWFTEPPVNSCTACHDS